MDQNPHFKAKVSPVKYACCPRTRLSCFPQPIFVVLGICLTVLSSLSVADIDYTVDNPGTYTYPNTVPGDTTGPIDPIVLATGENFWFRGNSAGSYTLLNNFNVNQNGSINWSGGSADTVVFSGDVYVLGSRIFLSNDTYAPGKDTTFTGTFTLNQDATIYSEPANNGGPPLLSGGISGASHTLYIRSDHLGRTLRIGGLGSALDVAQIDIASSDLRVEAANASDDYFGQVNANGGDVVVKGRLYLQRGSFDLDRDIDLQGGTLYLEPLSDGAVALQTNGTPGTAVGPGHAVPHLDLPHGVLGPVTVIDGGMITHTTGWPNSITLSDDVILEDGAVWRFNHANLTHLWFAAGKTLTLGDGDIGTAENIIIRTIGTHSNGPQMIEPHTIVDDGNVTLTYQSTTGNSFMGWDDPNDSNSMGTFREGSAGTVFDTAEGTFKVVGIDTNDNAFIATGPVSVTGSNAVSFHLPNNIDQSVVNSERTLGTLANVRIDNGGAFVISDSAATVTAAVVNVESGGTLGGIGTYAAPIVVNSGGTLSPGTSPGTLSVGDVTLQSGAEILMEIAGETKGTQYDVLSTSSTITINGGTLNVVFDGYQPGMTGASFDLFDGTLTGSFDILDLPTLPYDFLRWETDELYTAGIITAIPEPTSVILLAAGALAVLKRRR